MNDNKEYVLVSYFSGTGDPPRVCGPYTYQEADDLLRKAATIVGDYCSNMGYWSNLPG